MADAESVSFLGVPCPKGFRLRTLTLQAWDAMDYVRADWVDTVVVVERGELEVECRSGARALFHEGASLVFSGLGLRRLRNAGNAPLVLSALSRIRPAD
jgi:hypothetical protein